MKDDRDHKPRSQQVSIKIEPAYHVWLWREKRRRERSIAWIVNQAISQYRDRLEKGRNKEE